MNSFTWSLPHDLLTASISIMRPHGARGNEGLALWFGTGDDYSATITHVVEVFGSGFRNFPLYMELSLAAMASLTDLADSLGLVLVGQIHSHPGTFTDLSQLDIAQGIRSPLYLSVVCPHYAQRDVSGYLECGVHVFDGGRYWRLPQHEIEARFNYTAAGARRIRHEVKA